MVRHGKAYELEDCLLRPKDIRWKNSGLLGQFALSPIMFVNFNVKWLGRSRTHIRHLKFTLFKNLSQSNTPCKTLWALKRAVLN